jgi:hypothetical protein
MQQLPPPCHAKCVEEQHSSIFAMCMAIACVVPHRKSGKVEVLVELNA